MDTQGLLWTLLLEIGKVDCDTTRKNEDSPKGKCAQWQIKFISSTLV